MIEHLRSIKSKTISNDGGLSLVGQGTFGWMLTDAKGKQLITGSGPVDGREKAAHRFILITHRFKFLPC
jgi:hypothetical protein